MPEIKNAFTQGKMNKDLDERLIQNGLYRNAVNVSVETAENSGVGTARNILGNSRVDALVPDSYFCIGSISNERTNKLYWFVKGEDTDAILEYDKKESESKIIVADKVQDYEGYKPFLNFTGKQITGINIVDDFLFWSDGDNEPKKINISHSYHSNPTLSLDNPNLEPAYLYANEALTEELLKEEHITVIKKKPSIAPTVKLTSAKGEAGSAIFEKVFLRFCVRYKYLDGEYSAFSPFTDVVFNPEHDELISSVNAYSTDEPYNKSMVNLIKSIELYDFITPDMPEDVVQVDILYKEENSTAIYSVANIKVGSGDANAPGSGQFNVDASESSYKGKYEITSENIHAVLPSNQLLRPFDAIPKSALGQEIVGNRLVYANYKQGYDFVDDVPTVDGYYSLRQFQDFSKQGLKSIKSQRKYQLGYLLGDEYGRETPIFTSTQAGVSVDWSSSDYGLNASNSTMFYASLFGDLPDWASYYKFYVKSSSDEYYNLLMDKSYFPFTHNEFENKDDHIYVSFPSSDRNKLVEDDYIIAKKIYDSTNAQVFEENKYKILDISNEAPDAVKYVFFSLGSAANNANDILCSGLLEFSASSLFAGPQVLDSIGKRIDQQTDTIHLHKTGWLSSTIDGAPLLDADGNYNNDVYISWNVGDIYSERYKVSNIRISGTSENVYVLKLTNTISEKDARLAAVNDTIQTLDFETVGNNTVFALDAGLVFKCEKRQLRSQEDFSGKFFVKIKHNNYLTGNDQSTGLYPVASNEARWLFGHLATSGDPSEGIINSASSSIGLDGAVPASDITGVDGFANTPLEWVKIKEHIGNSFFIDDMNFVATNPSSDFEAKESGKAAHASSIKYKSFEWGQLYQSAFDYESVVDSLTFDSLNPDFEGENLYGWKYVKSSSDGIAENTDWTNLELSLKSWAPRVGSPVGSISFDQGYYASRIYNSFEGIVTSTNDHTFSSNNTLSREFRVNSIYASSSTDYGGPSSFYGDTPGRHFIHISFLAPGVDLIDQLDADDLVGVKIKGADSIASKLQGIWGGGAFHKLPAQSNTYNSAFQYIFDSFGELPDHEGNVVEFEGNYASSLSSGENDLGLPPTASLNAAPGPGIGQGYDANYATRHEQQWNPAYSDSGPNNEIASFVQRLKTPGQKFKFQGDTSNTVYTIQGVNEQHVYNHTSWRAIWLPNSDGSAYEFAGSSVEEAASAWADFTNADLTPSANSSIDGYSTAATNLANAITNFGAASNRRTVFIIELDKNPEQHYDPRFDPGEIDATTSTQIEFVSDIAPSLIDSLFSSPTIWETEPLQLADLNIYHEASNNIPTKITSKTNELFAPVGSEIKGFVGDAEEPVYITEWVSATKFKTNIDLPEGSYIASTFKFCRHDESYVQAVISGQEGQNTFEIQEKVRTEFPVGLSWFNCFSFGDGIESNRIRDGYNKMQISSGARVSATLEEPFIEEHRTNGLIYSGIYNSNSNTNNLNQFIAAEKITKDLNPTYGSIQKLFTRNTDLVALCEDRVIKILANKDALFNADGNPQLVSTANVLGQAVPFVGDYGISTHPESFAADTYRAYFTDKQRGAVLRLSMDGITPISDAGMREYFRDNLVDQANFVGSYDGFSQQYNLTIKKIPIVGSILQDDLSEGIEPIEQFNPEEYIDNGDFSQGSPFQGIVQLEDLDLVERNATQNSELASSVTIVNYPAISQFGLVPDDTILIAGVEGQSTIFNPYATNEAPTSWGFTNNLFVNAFQDSGNPFVSFGLDENKFFINRFSNHSTYYDSSTGGNPPNALPTPGSNAINEEDEGAAWNYPDFNIGYSDESINMLFGSSDNVYWSAPVAIFCQTETTNTPFTPPNYGSANSWSKGDESHTGIIFRGTPDNGYFGYIDVPASGFVSGGTSLITEDIASAFTGVDNTTMFNGEEIQLTVSFGANNIGSIVQNRIRIQLLDGAELLDSSRLVGGGTVGFDTDDIYTSLGVTNLSSSDFSTTTEKASAYITGEAGGFVDAVEGPNFITYRFKFTNPDNPYEDGIAVQNLVVRIHVEGNGSLATLQTTQHKALVAIGETVIKGFRVKKLNQFTQHFIENVDEVTSDGIPQQEIPAWSEVIYPDNIDGFTTTGDIYAEHLAQFGPENPGEVVSYSDLAGNELTYEVGESNGVIDASYSGTTDLNATLSPGNITANLDPAKPLVFDKWYLLEISGDELFGQGLPFIRFVDSSGVEVNCFVNNIDNIQIGQGSNNTSILTPAHDFQDNVSRALFKLQPSASTTEASNITQLEIINSTTNVSSIKLIDISAQSEGGNVDFWNINPDLYAIQRAFVPGALTTGYSHPSLYFAGNRVNFGVGSFGSSFSQELPVLPETSDGYKLSIVVSEDFLSQQLVLNESNTLGVSVQDGGAATSYPLTQGLNQIDLNFSNQSATLTFTGAGLDIAASVSSVSLLDITNYFTSGNAGSWIIDGFDQAEDGELGTENFITWTSGLVSFNGATSGHRLHQQVDLPEGQTFILTFDSNVQSIPTAGSLKVSYRNAQGFQVGLKLVGPSTDGNVSFQFTVDPNDFIAQDLPGSIIFEAIGTTPLFATIDNIELRRVITDQEFGVPIQTISYNEDVKGWVSFKSFIPENGVSLSSQYFTLNNGQLWQHNTNEQRNNFYGMPYDSSITAVLNTEPSTVKNFNTVNYEGSENWSLSEIKTDLDEGFISEFVKKENKWFNYIKGVAGDFDTSKFNVQGLGLVSHTIEE